MRIKRLLARLLLLVIATLLAFVGAEVALRLLTEGDLHVRFKTEYRDELRRGLTMAEAWERGYLVAIDDDELIRARELLTDGAVRFEPEGNVLRALGSPAGSVSGTGWAIVPGAIDLPSGPVRERIEIKGTKFNDGLYRVVSVAPDGATVLDRPVRAERCDGGVDIRGLRPRGTFAANKLWHYCFTGLKGTKWESQFDADGCVEVRINSALIRDREDVVGPKPVGQRRIVCLGDSFTFGWGVEIENAWPRTVEAELRRKDDGIRTVNCGASGSMYPDEYVNGLVRRFFDFSPDAVVLTLCLNDLLPTAQALTHPEPLPWLLEQSRLLRGLFQNYAFEARLRIAPERDLVGELLALPDERYALWCVGFPDTSVGRAGLWPGGGPQRALLRARDECQQRGLPYGVVIWPYFQGLGAAEHYPFEKMHRMVGDFCGEHGIPFLDLLPTFRRKVAHTDELWVSPADPHGNARAHAMATPSLTAFLGDLLESK